MKKITVEMTLKQAEALGIVFCECGHCICEKYEMVIVLPKVK